MEISYYLHHHYDTVGDYDYRDFQIVKRTIEQPEDINNPIWINRKKISRFTTIVKVWSHGYYDSCDKIEDIREDINTYCLDNTIPLFNLESNCYYDWK